MPAPLWLVEKSFGIDRETMLPAVLEGRAARKDMLFFCGLYRRIGVCQLFLDGVPNRAFVEWANSGRAWLQFLRTSPPAEQIGSQSAPFFDAVASGDDEGARAIAESTRPDHHQGEEYEEDFVFIRYLMDEAFARRPAAELDAALTRWEQVLEGGVDPRLPVCQALRVRDSKSFDESFHAWMEGVRLANHDGVKGDRITPDDAQTVAKISVEGLAMVAIAGRAGLTIRADYPLVPSIARAGDRKPAVDPNGWRTVESYLELE